MAIRHGGFKLLVSCSILFDQSEIVAIPVEYTVPSNWRLHMVLVGQHNCSTRIQGSSIPVLKGFMVSPVIMICGLPLSTYLYFTSLGDAAWLNIVNVVVASPMLTVLGFLVVSF